MELEEKINQEYAEAFGLEPTETADPEGTGGAADPVQEQSAGAESAAEEDPGTEEPGAKKAVTEPARRQEMSPEERHRQAEARRAREDQERRQAEQRRVDKVYEDMFAGQVNPYTGKPITTEAEYRAYQAEKAKQEQNQQLRKAGITPETIQSIVDQQLGPIKEQVMRANMQAAQEMARAANEQAQEVIGTFVKGLSTEWPEIKSMEDIAAMPTAQEFNEYVQLGLPLNKAFYLANCKEIEARKIAAAKAAALNGVAGKSHLNPLPAGGGSEPVEVPAAMRDSYREIMPDATDEEIRKAYAKYLKDIKKG